MSFSMSRRPPAGPQKGGSVGTLVRRVLTACRSALVSIALLSGVINVLYLTGSFFMLEVYDRVLPSRSVPTLVGLGLLAAMLFAFQGVLDLIRGRMLVRIGGVFDESVSGPMFQAMMRAPLVAKGSEAGAALRDADQIRSFISSGGPVALFDLPWMPLYVGICFLFHPLIGIAALVGALILIVTTILTEVMTRTPMRDAVRFAGRRASLAEAARRNAETVHALGMGGRIERLWSRINADYMRSHQKASDVSGGFGSFSKVMRMMVQSGVLAVGAFLVIRQDATAGIIIASSILSARSLAPVELAVANWKNFQAARLSWRRLNDLLAAFPEREEPLALPAPQASLAVEGISVVPTGGRAIVLHEIAFGLKAGSGLGVIGPSGSGKSTLARALVGIWRPVAGKVRIDGAALDQWSPDSLGRHVGYLPQDVVLFDGTVAENIARFDETPDAEAVVAAAKAAGVHDLIVRLPQGYDTPVGEGGEALSGGQRQRVGLARALYRDPFLVVLDEPNAHLDSAGEEALVRAIASVRARGGIVVIGAHRPSALSEVDHMLVLSEGRQQIFGPRDEVLAKLRAGIRPAPPPHPMPQRPAPAGAAAVRPAQGGVAGGMTGGMSGGMSAGMSAGMSGSITATAGAASPAIFQVVSEPKKEG
ncbi:ATP-binding cassette, subfamily C [Pseudoxanthobacter soli DSM 19599]|uniref:ATP-binding cassette, subfamily C n=2 Tax=Pseudoxanthobacter TaxID=433838 RepID=A0A1M7ZGW7_9HYPH|nr:ATP-binding cassette, subfamily C [Pseudoxanthobacter soli DSM 19599]